MKHFITGLILLALATAGWLVFRQLPAKAIYDQLRGDNSCSLVNEPALAALSLKQSILGWCCTKQDEAVPEVLAVVGWKRELSKAVDLLSYKMPGYSWLSGERNKRATLLKAGSGIVRSVDRKVHNYIVGERQRRPNANSLKECTEHRMTATVIRSLDRHIGLPRM